MLASLLLQAPFCASAQNTLTPSPQMAVVATSSCYLRTSADYTSELETQALMGALVEITGSQGYWRQVKTNYPRPLWVNELSLMELSDVHQYLVADKYIVSYAGVVYALAEPAKYSARVCDLVLGDVLRMAHDGGGAAVKENGYAKALLPDEREVWVPEEVLAPYGEWVSSRELTEQNVVSSALDFLGVPYFWGGFSIKGVDCSGLSGQAYLLNGLMLPRNASQQVKCGVEVPLGHNNDKLENLRMGDLLFFGRAACDGKKEAITHVGIYIGNGKMIHSSQVVRINSLVAGSNDYYKRNILHARRIIGHESEGAPVRRLSLEFLPGSPVE